MGRQPETIEEWGIAIGVCLGPERARAFADALIAGDRTAAKQLAEGLLFSAAQASKPDGAA